MDKVYVEATYKSLNKLNEELCGDRVEIVKNDDSYFVVLSDGLGSGVKANTFYINIKDYFYYDVSRCKY